MKDTANTDLGEIKSQLKQIKNIINVSSSEFRLIYAADNFRRFFVLSGIFSLLLPLIYQSLLWGYGSMEAVPQFMLVCFYILIGVCWCVLVIIRTKTSIAEAKRLGIDTNILKLTKKVLSTKLILALIPLILVFAALPFKYAAAFVPSDYIPYTGMAVGLVLNIIGVMLHEKEYSFGGLWMLISAAMLFFLAALPGHMEFAVIFAPGCFLFAAVNKYMVKRHEAD